MAVVVPHSCHPHCPSCSRGCLVRSQPSASLDGVPCWVTAIGYLIRSLPLRVVGGVVHLAAAVAAIGVVCPLLCCHRWWVLCPTVVITVGAWWVTVAKGAPPLPWVSPRLSSWSYGAPPWSSSWLWVLSWPWVHARSLSWSWCPHPPACPHGHGCPLARHHGHGCLLIPPCGCVVPVRATLQCPGNHSGLAREDPKRIYQRI